MVVAISSSCLWNTYNFKALPRESLPSVVDFQSHNYPLITSQCSGLPWVLMASSWDSQRYNTGRICWPCHSALADLAALSRVWKWLEQNLASLKEICFMVWVAHFKTLNALNKSLVLRLSRFESRGLPGQPMTNILQHPLRSKRMIIET